MNKEYLDKAIIISNNMINLFNEILDIPKDCFDFIKEIPIIINFSSGFCGVYLESYNQIRVNNFYIEECKNKDDILELARVITHERIHASRAIFIENIKNTVDYNIEDPIYKQIFLPCDYDLHNDKDFKKYKGIEEFITNGISFIVMFYYIVGDYNKIKELIDNYKVNDKYDKLNKEEMSLIYSLGPEFIKTFLLSAYNDVYIDPLDIINESNKNIISDMYSSTYK